MGLDGRYTIVSKEPKGFNFTRKKTCILCGVTVYVNSGIFKYCDNCKNTKEFKEKEKKERAAYMKMRNARVKRLGKNAK